jgi:hypothetical protein
MRIDFVLVACPSLKLKSGLPVAEAQLNLNGTKPLTVDG